MPVAYSPSKSASKRSRSTSTAASERNPSSMIRKPSLRKRSTCSSERRSSTLTAIAIASHPVTGLRDTRLAALLDDVAAATPAPGGGSSAALAAGLAAALVEMAAGIAGASEAAARARSLRERAMALAEDELSSYAPVLEAERLPRDDPARAARIDVALTEASRVPLEVAELAADTAALGAEVADASGAALRGDAVTGVLLAEAAAAAAATLVDINLGARPEDPARERVRAARSRAREAHDVVAPRV
jgi:formiminotetrahydrofolate cyclodeaminase